MSEEEPLEGLDTRRSEAVGIRNAMPSLLKHEGWILLCDAMNEECLILYQRLLAPCASQEDAYMHEGLKAELRAIQRILSTPQHMLDEASAVIDALNERTDDNE